MDVGTAKGGGAAAEGGDGGLEEYRCFKKKKQIWAVRFNSTTQIRAIAGNYSYGRPQGTQSLYIL